MDIVSYEPRYYKSYQSFAQQAWGPFCYQAKESYLDWLYVDSPLNRSYADFLIAVDDDANVIGCVHKMYLRWQHANVDQEEVLPTIHNLMVLEEHRTGIGAYLLREAVESEPFAFLPTGAGRIGQLYQRMGYIRYTPFRHRTVIAPLRGVWNYLRRRYVPIGRNHAFDRSRIERKIRRLPIEVAGYLLSDSPSDSEIVRLATTLNSFHTGFRLKWDLDLLQWRFFNRSSPQTMLLADETQENAVLFAIEDRHYMKVCRVLDIYASSNSQLLLLFAALKRAAIKLGTHVLMIYSMSKTQYEMLESLGIRSSKDPFPCFLVQQEGIEQLLGISAGAVDYGLDSIGWNSE